MDVRLRLHNWVLEGGEVLPSPSRASQTVFDLFMSRPDRARFAVGWVYEVPTFRVIDMYDLRNADVNTNAIVAGAHWDYASKEAAMMAAIMKL